MALSQEKLLSVAALKTYTNLSGTFDSGRARIAVVRAQRSYLLPKLGNTLYQKLLTDVRDDPTPDDVDTAFAAPYQDLVLNFIQPFLLWGTLLEILEDNYLKISNSQVVRLSATTDSDPGTGAEYQQKRDLILQKMDDDGDALSEHLAFEGSNTYIELADDEDILSYQRDGRNYDEGPMYVSKNDYSNDEETYI